MSPVYLLSIYLVCTIVLPLPLQERIKVKGYITPIPSTGTR